VANAVMTHEVVPPMGAHRDASRASCDPANRPSYNSSSSRANRGAGYWASGGRSCGHAAAVNRGTFLQSPLFLNNAHRRGSSSKTLLAHAEMAAHQLVFFREPRSINPSSMPTPPTIPITTNGFCCA
jgi:hypothetical protein